MDAQSFLLQIFKKFQTSPRFHFLIFLAHIWRNYCW